MNSTKEKIIEELKIPSSWEKEYKIVWDKFSEALNKRCVKSLTYNEGFIAWSIIRLFKPKNFLEIGGQHGHSGIIFTDAMKRHGGKFYTIEAGNNINNKYPNEIQGTLEFLPDNDPNIVKIWGLAEDKLTELLQNEEIEMVFHDGEHSWGHVLFCVTEVLKYRPNCIQSCHDCADGLWNPDVITAYGFALPAERPIFDQYFNNDNYYYRILSEKHGFGVAILKEKTEV
jgi:hypothetical protein